LYISGNVFTNNPFANLLLFPSKRKGKYTGRERGGREDK
jgi:hypothetical protein